MHLIPRRVGFVGERAVCAGVACEVTPHTYLLIVKLPTDHYDFIGPIKVKGKTLTEIEAEVRAFQADMR